MPPLLFVFSPAYVQGGHRWSHPQVPAHNPFPALCVMETMGSLYIHAQLPGVMPGEVFLIFRGNALFLKGRITAQKGQYHLQERFAGAFCRRIDLHQTVDKKKCQCRLENGLLEVCVPLQR